MTRFISYSFMAFSLFILSACGTWLDQRQPKVDVQMREDSGNLVTPMPPALKSDTDGYAPYEVGASGSVNVMDITTPNMTSAIPHPATQFGYSGGGIQAADPSVTIFPLDGDVAPLAQSYTSQGAIMNYDTGGYVSPQYGSSEGQIFFKHGSSRLGSGDLNKLSNVAEQAKFAPVNRITVEGYASRPTQAGSQTVEGHILNLKESMNRSFAVSKNLMQRGVPAEKVKTVSWGSVKATGDNNYDRRVDVVMGER
jgi:outer membrane protein OmpA-like peptidoglycan-associated protein